MLNATSSLNDLAAGASQKPVGIAVVGLLFHTAVARSVVRIVEAADQSLCLGGHEISLQHEDIESQLIEFSRPDERRELAAV